MPAISKSQQRIMAMAKHNPKKLYKKNKGLLKMTSKQLSDFAETKHKGLPEHKESAMEKEVKKVAKKRRG